MLRFLAIRLLQFPLILVVIYVTTFMLAWVAPGDPFERDRKLPTQTVNYLQQEFHAKNAWSFLAYYPLRVLTTGDFGPSLNTPEFSVNDIMKKSLPVSMAVGLAALAIAIVAGVTIGAFAAVRRSGVFDFASLAVALLGVSVPSFVVASLLLTAFAFNRHWLPLGGWPGGVTYALVPNDTPTRQAAYATAKPELKDALDHPEKYFEFAAPQPGAAPSAGLDISEHQGVPIDDLSARTGFDWNQLFDHAGDYFQLHTAWAATAKDYFLHLLLPAIALAMLPMAYIVQLTRVSMLDVIGSDYVRTARAKGLSKPRVILKHCMRNAMLPVLSYLGPAAAATLTGSFVVEKVFNIPGIGDYFVHSVLNRDQTLILGTVMVYSVFLLSLNLLVDVLYSVIDPRIELTKGRG